MSRIVCVIPARLESSRFPRKILADLAGKPLLQWAWDAASRCPLFDEVVFAIDSEETARVIEEFGGKFRMTAKECLSGTDRLVELFKNGLVHGDIWVNWQADEPFISEAMIRDLLQSSQDGADVWTLKMRLTEMEKITSSDICKVVCDAKGYALYFSRSPIPYHRNLLEGENFYFKHIGLYAYSADALEKISRMYPCAIERAESLEQLRFLFYGLKIKVHETEHETIGIDQPEHLAKARQFLAAQF